MGSALCQESGKGGGAGWGKVGSDGEVVRSAMQKILKLLGCWQIESPVKVEAAKGVSYRRTMLGPVKLLSKVYSTPNGLHLLFYFIPPFTVRRNIL